MRKQAAIREETGRSSYGGQLPLFDQIVRGFLKELSNHKAGVQAASRLEYLDGRISIAGQWCSRRTLILAIEDLKDQIEAPQLLRREVRDFMKLLGFDHIPELKMYRDVATAIMRIDAALHLSRINGTRKPAAASPVYH
jgi:hypothetical protein